MSETVYLFEISHGDGSSTESGEVEAHDVEHARRLLAGRFGLHQPNDRILISDKSEMTEAQARTRANTLRYVLQTLADHHEWLQDVEKGERGDLSGLNLSGLDLSNRNLAMLNLSYVNLTGANLRGANLQGVDLSGANLNDTDLREADLSKADLSDADLRGAHLTGADMSGADLWRANLNGTIVPPEQLHAALGCGTEDT